MENSKKTDTQIKGFNTDDLLKLLLIFQLLDKVHVKLSNNCNLDKEIKDYLSEILTELKLLREECNINKKDIQTLIKELELNKGNSTLPELIKDILKANKKELEVLIEDKSNMVLDELEEILRNNYNSLVKLLESIHNSLAVKLIGALIFFLAGVVVGSWIERFVLNRVIVSFDKELHIKSSNQTALTPLKGKP